MAFMKFAHVLLLSLLSTSYVEGARHRRYYENELEDDSENLVLPHLRHLKAGKKGAADRADENGDKALLEADCETVKNAVKDSEGMITQALIDDYPQCDFDPIVTGGTKFGDVVNVIVDRDDTEEPLIFGPAMVPPEDRVDVVDTTCEETPFSDNKLTTCTQQVDCVDHARSYAPYAPCCLKVQSPQSFFCVCGSSNPTVLFNKEGDQINACVVAEEVGVDDPIPINP